MFLARYTTRYIYLKGYSSIIMTKLNDIIKIYDPDTKKIVSGIVTRIALNGIRADVPGCGIVSATMEIYGVWCHKEDEKEIQKIVSQGGQ